MRTRIVGALIVALGALAGCGPLEPEQLRTALSRPLAPSVDVTMESGRSITSRAASWRTTSGDITTEHLAGTDSKSQLIHFFWNRLTGRWTAENVSALAGATMTGLPSAWVTPDGSYTVEHLAGRSPDNHLRVFYRSTRDNTWRVVDVTAKTGQTIADSVTSWLAPNGTMTVEHLAGRNASGNLVVFWWSPAHDWQAVDVSAKTGHLIASAVTSWQLYRGSVLYEYLAANGADGLLTVFSFTPAQDWQAQVTPWSAPDGAAPWLNGSVEHLGGVDPAGTLYVLWRNGTGSWSRVDVTAITGERASGRPVAYELTDDSGHAELLGARSPSGHLLAYWWRSSRDWQAIDLTEINGQSVLNAPEAWVTYSGTRPIEHLAALGSDSHLRVFYSYDQPRTLTDEVANEYQSIRRLRNTSRRVLVVLWDPHYPGVPKPDKAVVQSLVFGATDSVRGYFLENSGGAFTIANAGTLGWYDAEQPLEWYDSATSPHDKAGAALIAADPDINFAAYDSDRDGTLEPHELAIVFAHPGRVGGLTRTGSREVRDLDGSILVLDGVTIRECVELGIGNPTPNFSVFAHELSHLLFGLPDMYFTFFTPTAAGMYSLMDSTYDGTHLDPFNKMKMGWAQPRLVFRSARYTLPDIETHHRVTVLMDPDRSTREYFLVENRYRGTSYDGAMRDEGLAVWHIMEDSAVFDAALPPSTVSMSNWASLGTGSGAWGRKAIRMVRPILTAPFDDSQALWDGTDPATGYDLLSTDANPAHATLQWGDGMPSGFALTSMSGPAADMAVTITVP